MGINPQNPRQKPPSYQLSHPRLGPLSVYLEKEEQQLMQIILQVQNKDEYQKWEKTIEQYRKESNMLLLPRQTFLQDLDLCGSALQSRLIFDYYPFTLHNQIYKRKIKSLYYQEKEVWFILRNLIVSCVQFQFQQMFHSDIRPKNILLNQQGDLRVINRISLPNFRPPFVAALHFGEIPFFSPEQLNLLKSRQNPLRRLNIQHETFSIGLTLLCVCTLSNLQEVYYQHDIDLHQIQRILNQSNFRGIYSQTLQKLIRHMLLQDPLKRLSPGQVFSLISPYQDAINNFQSFSVQPNQSLRQMQRYNCILKETAKKNELIQQYLLAQDKRRSPFNSTTKHFPSVQEITHSQPESKNLTLKRLANSK